jgi:hypothetical protein
LSYLLLAPSTELDITNKIKIGTGIEVSMIQSPSYKGPSIHLQEFERKIQDEKK